MTPERLRECMKVLGWSGVYLSSQVGKNEKQVRRWLLGEGLIPMHTADWIEKWMRLHEANPNPKAQGGHRSSNLARAIEEWKRFHEANRSPALDGQFERVSERLLDVRDRLRLLIDQIQLQLLLIAARNQAQIVIKSAQQLDRLSE